MTIGSRDPQNNASQLLAKRRCLSLGTGHTLIELLAVIVIASVMALGGSTLMAGRDEFAPSLVKDQLISSLRLAQQNAVSRSTSANVTHTLNQVSGNFRFTISQTGSSSERQLEDGGISITWSSSALTGSCAAVTGTLPHALAFDADGETTATRYCISGQSEYSVCVSGLGFAYEGACDI